jgi:hypothetical protein
MSAKKGIPTLLKCKKVVPVEIHQQRLPSAFTGRILKGIAERK